jgi:hypothetical protein
MPTPKRATPRTKPTRSDPDRAEVIRKFKSLVNLTPAALEKFLKTDASKKVGFTYAGAKESVGHASGRRIIHLLKKKTADLTADDLAHMRKVIGYIKRHLAQGPHDEKRVPTSRWRYSLMNWGHDPLEAE